MSIYVYLVTKQRKLITFKCRDRHEARIVQQNLIRSDLLDSVLTMDISYQVEQEWLKRCNMYDTQQLITYESNKTYYYPFSKGDDRV